MVAAVVTRSSTTYSSVNRRWIVQSALFLLLVMATTTTVVHSKHDTMRSVTAQGNNNNNNDFSIIGGTTNKASIVGGRPAPKGLYPFFVFSDGGCGGTLIHEDIVLTAAHCYDAYSVKVHIGGTLVDLSDSEEMDIASTCPHPKYQYLAVSEAAVNDVMLVQLSKSSKAPTVKLNYWNASIPAIGNVVTAIGFGKPSFDSEMEFTPTLQRVNLDTFADSSCAKQYGDYVPKTMVCAGTVKGGKDTCYGDSGGPLLTSNLVQIGITSYGDGCGIPNVPAVYTQVSAFTTYIRSGICALSRNPPWYCKQARYNNFDCSTGRSSSSGSPPIPKPPIQAPVQSPTKQQKQPPRAPQPAREPVRRVLARSGKNLR